MIPGRAPRIAVSRAPGGLGLTFALWTEGPFLFANGKMSLALELRTRPDLRSASRADISHLVFLDRRGEPDGSPVKGPACSSPTTPGRVSGARARRPRCGR